MKMTADLSKLCSRVAMEESRQAAWDRAKQLRAECTQRLKSNTPSDVQAWLQSLMDNALHAQVRARDNQPPKGN